MKQFKMKKKKKIRENTVKMKRTTDEQLIGL